MAGRRSLARSHGAQGDVRGLLPRRCADGAGTLLRFLAVHRWRFFSNGLHLGHLLIATIKEGFPSKGGGGTPKALVDFMENPMKRGDLEVPPSYGNSHLDCRYLYPILYRRDRCVFRLA